MTCLCDVYIKDNSGKAIRVDSLRDISSNSVFESAIYIDLESGEESVLTSNAEIKTLVSLWSDCIIWSRAELELYRELEFLKFSTGIRLRLNEPKEPLPWRSHEGGELFAKDLMYFDYRSGFHSVFTPIIKASVLRYDRDGRLVVKFTKRNTGIGETTGYLLYNVRDEKALEVLFAKIKLIN